MRNCAATKGKLFVISAPSGSGKTTLCKKLLADKLQLVHSISMTTRPPRPGEKNGIDYHFVSTEHFQDMIRKKGFLEYEDNFGYFYGTPKEFIEERLAKGLSILLAIDVKGAMKVKKAYPRGSVFVFILPPSIRTLEKRLRSRMSDGPKAIEKRLALAKKEIACQDRYDHRIVNDNFSSAYRRLKNIIVKRLNEGKVQGKKCD